MLEMTVLDVNHVERGFTDRKTGESKVMRLQPADLLMPGNRHPVDFEHAVMEGSPLLSPGVYTLDPSSFYLGKYNKPTLGNLKWLALA